MGRHLAGPRVRPWAIRLDVHIFRLRVRPQWAPVVGTGVPARAVHLRGCSGPGEFVKFCELGIALRHWNPGYFTVWRHVEGLVH